MRNNNVTANQTLYIELFFIASCKVISINIPCFLFLIIFFIIVLFTIIVIALRSGKKHNYCCRYRWMSIKSDNFSIARLKIKTHVLTSLIYPLRFSFPLIHPPPTLAPSIFLAIKLILKSPPPLDFMVSPGLHILLIQKKLVLVRTPQKKDETIFGVRYLYTGIIYRNNSRDIMLFKHF